MILEKLEKDNKKYKKQNLELRVKNKKLKEENEKLKKKISIAKQWMEKEVKSEVSKIAKENI
jgi:hypothetical protein